MYEVFRISRVIVSDCGLTYTYLSLWDQYSNSALVPAIWDLYPKGGLDPSGSRFNHMMDGPPPHPRGPGVGEGSELPKAASLMNKSVKPRPLRIFSQQWQAWCVRLKKRKTNIIQCGLFLFYYHLLPFQSPEATFLHLFWKGTCFVQYFATPKFVLIKEFSACQMTTTFCEFLTFLWASLLDVYMWNCKSTHRDTTINYAIFVS